jgi:hypothetical protein
MHHILNSAASLQVLSLLKSFNLSGASVATAIANIFQNNGISLGRNLAKILKNNLGIMTSIG